MAGEFAETDPAAAAKFAATLPAEVLTRPDPSDAASYDTLVRRSVQALGVADLKAITDYFYLPGPAVRDSLDRLPGELPLPSDLAEGDYLIFHGAGAYSTVTNTRFNGFGELQMATVLSLKL